MIVVAAISDRGVSPAVEVAAKAPMPSTNPTPRAVTAYAAGSALAAPKAAAKPIELAPMPVAEQQTPLAGDRVDRVPIALLPDAPAEIKAEVSPFRLDMLPVLTEDGSAFESDDEFETAAAPSALPLRPAGRKVLARRTLRGAITATARLPQP